MEHADYSSLCEKTMLAKTFTSSIFGIDAYLIEVEVDIAKGLPYFSTVKLN